MDEGNARGFEGNAPVEGKECDSLPFYRRYPENCKEETFSLLEAYRETLLVDSLVGH